MKIEKVGETKLLCKWIEINNSC